MLRLNSAWYNTDMKILICHQCGTETLGGNRRKYCDACRIFIKRERSKADYQKHKEKRNAQIRRWRESKGPEYERQRQLSRKERDPEAYKASARKRALDYHYRNRDRENAEHRAYLFRVKYGITPEQYEDLSEKQNGGCAICQRPCPSGRRLAVDHDHETGRVRGLLCMDCNQGLGKFGDDISRLKAAVQYLTTHGLIGA